MPELSAGTSRPRPLRAVEPGPIIRELRRRMQAQRDFARTELARGARIAGVGTLSELAIERSMIWEAAALYVERRAQRLTKLAESSHGRWHD